MFSLIVVLISIVLVGALALAVSSYVGPLSQGAQDKTRVAGLLNQASQISASAIAHHSQQGVYATSLDDLVAAEYLKTLPEGWSAYEDTLVVTGVTPSQCALLNEQAGYPAPPLCDDPAIVGRMVCCEQVVADNLEIQP